MLCIMKTHKIKDDKTDAKSPLWDMLRSCKPNFFILGSSITLREGKKFDWKWTVLRIFLNSLVCTDRAQHQKPRSQQVPLGRATNGKTYKQRVTLEGVTSIPLLWGSSVGTDSIIAGRDHVEGNGWDIRTPNRTSSWISQNASHLAFWVVLGEFDGAG